MYFSRIMLQEDAKSSSDFWQIFRNPYALHQAVWRLFGDHAERKRDFIYRMDHIANRPVVYIVSAREPNNAGGLWKIDMKKYEPKIVKGDCLAFKLRANPVHIGKEERTAAEIEAWQKSRSARRLKEKDLTKKRIRHDVVMAEKSRIGFRNLPQDQRPHVATLIQNAGLSWLREHADENGFSFEDSSVRADGYLQQRLFKGKGLKPITYSTLEFNGILFVTDADKFVNQCLFEGIGPAKGFGCGLMFVRRV